MAAYNYSCTWLLIDVEGPSSLGGSATPGRVVLGELRKPGKHARGASYSCTQYLQSGEKVYATTVQTLGRDRSKDNHCSSLLLAKTMTESNWEERVYLILQLSVLHWGKSEQEPGGGNWRGAIELLLACSPSCLADFLSSPRTMCPGVVLPPVSWALTRQSLINECPKDLPTGRSEGSISSTEISFSR